MQKRDEFGGRALIRELLEANKNAIHAGKGKRNAQLVRRVCNFYKFDEDEFLARHVKRNKEDWGL